MIASTVGVAEGVVDPWRVEEDLKAAGSDAVIARAVGKALGTTVKQIFDSCASFFDVTPLVIGRGSYRSHNPGAT
jgi:hypothetical protein